MTRVSLYTKAYSVKAIGYISDGGDVAGSLVLLFYSHPSIFTPVSLQLFGEINASDKQQQKEFYF
jgi:hypothetical protein